MIRAVSCHQVAALLTFVGLLAELGAVLSILLSVGLGDWLRLRWQAARTWLRSRWPWGRRDVTVHAPAATETLTFGESVEAKVIRATDRPPPRSFEDAGEALNAIRADLNRIEEMHHDLRRATGAEVGRVRGETSESTSRLREEVAEETRRELRARTLEGVIFFFGVVVQIFAAGVLLFAC
jgi:hypothetical protein